MALQFVHHEQPQQFAMAFEQYSKKHNPSIFIHWKVTIKLFIVYIGPTFKYRLNCLRQSFAAHKQLQDVRRCFLFQSRLSLEVTI